MFKDSQPFSSFSVDDLVKAKEFYGTTLGLKVTDESGMGLRLHLATGDTIFIYPKEQHEPATFTVLNFPVDDIDQTVDELVSRGVHFERYPDMFPQDEKGIARTTKPSDGSSIAWFKDPAGNILAIIQ